MTEEAGIIKGNGQAKKPVCPDCQMAGRGDGLVLTRHIMVQVPDGVLAPAPEHICVEQGCGRVWVPEGVCAEYRRAVEKQLAARAGLIRRASDADVRVAAAVNQKVRTLKVN